jgi:hypothetical protein
MYSQASTTAREAFAKGDEVLHLALPLNQQSGRVGPGGGYTSSNRSNASDDLNRVVREGWALLTASVVFVPNSQVSRDKFLTSGQQLAFNGEVVGYYVFTRDETKRQQSTEANENQSAHRVVPQRAPESPVRTRRSAGEIEPLRPLEG